MNLRYKNFTNTVGIAIFIFAVMIFSHLWPFALPTTGEHTGYISNTEVVSAWAIWPNRIAYIKTQLESSQEDAYCVGSDALLQELRNAQRHQQRVTIRYQNGLWLPPSQCVFGHSIITNVHIDEQK